MATNQTNVVPTGRSAGELAAQLQSALEENRRLRARLGAADEVPSEPRETVSPSPDVPVSASLSEETRRTLKKLGYKQNAQGIQSGGKFRPHRVCSKCGQLPGLVDSEHPLDKQIRKAKNQRIANKNDARALATIEAHLRQLENLRFSTSRCCGKRYVETVLDHQEALWQMWLHRKERLTCSVQQLRKAYGPGAQNRDDDFLIVRTLMACGDGKVGKLVAAFRREEEIQRARVAEAENPEAHV